MKSMARKGVLHFALVFTLALFSTTVSATDLTFDQTIFNTDYIAAGVGGERGGDGTSSISLLGVSGTVTKATLIWNGPGNSTDPAANASVTFAGNAITGTALGLSNSNCWNFNNSKAYKADVTSYVTGDGVFSLANLVKPGEDINGVSLQVFFNDGISTNNRDISLFYGNDSNQPFTGEDLGWNITLAGINYTSGTASMQFHVGDGQDFLDAPVLVNGTAISTGNQIFQGDTTPPSPKVALTGGNLWDINSFDITTLLTVGPNTLTVFSGTLNDCLSCVAIAVDLPAGAAPDQPSVPEPGTLLLLGSGLVGLVGYRRTKRMM